MFFGRGGACVYEKINVIHVIPVLNTNTQWDLRDILQKGLNVLHDDPPDDAKGTKSNSDVDKSINNPLYSISDATINDGVLYLNNVADEGGAFAAIGLGTNIRPDKYLSGAPPTFAMLVRRRLRARQH